MILALETATPICSVALYRPETGEINEKRASGRGAHSTKLLGFIHELLAAMNCSMDEVHAIAVSIGPGSFTGLRIASSAIKGLVFGRAIPILTFHTTYALASTALEMGLTGISHGLVDARRTHLYHQKIEVKAGSIISATKPAILSIEDLKNTVIKPKDHLFGTGLERLELVENHEGYVAPSDMLSISARQLINLMKADSKEVGLNAYIAKLGINAKELKILYSLD